ncbi:unnamed protein product [Brachionus calyciflorus]|uniref:CS domain-containing protein n=1 Tax=Brachionus calyciflorus TaxID=104777 RepID=A0A814H888_9BILA|nr:unnamed protein product [Brachionus calyciflorus]
MVQITEELVRRKAEHNEGEIFSLEELSLHQENIEKIEHLDKWCRDLKILYLQSNQISKIENVSRFKKLEYINLALNNIERIENLEGCEFLKKLDLTVNFVGELTSIENLTENYHLKDLYLTGNPCTDFEGYRDYVISTLPQLKTLDGVEIKKSDRIKALQNYKSICNKINKKQNEYFQLREKQKNEYMDLKEKKKFDFENDEEQEKFWQEKTDYTPESRLETARIQQEIKRKQDEERQKHQKEHSMPKKERKYFDENGKPYCFNDPKVDYEFTSDHDEYILLTVHVFKHMDTSLINVDVQPYYVRVTLKGKSLQIAFNEEVKPDSSTAKRSQVTGHLVIKMPKLNPVLRTKPEAQSEIIKKESKAENKKNTFLEFNESKKSNLELISNIVQENEKAKKSNTFSNNSKKIFRERENSPDFVDDSSVPPLE